MKNRRMMYVCTLKNIYSSRCSHIAVQVGTELNSIGNAVVYNATASNGAFLK